MGHGATIKRSERYFTLCSVIALHTAALILLFLSRGQNLAPPPDLSGLKMISLAASPPASAPPLPPIISVVTTQPARLNRELPSLAEGGSSLQLAARPGCTTLEQVRQSVASDPAAIFSALNAPPETRSIAEAVVIWNGDWVPAAASADTPLAPTRAAIERSVAGLSRDCLDEPIAGPRLIPFPAGTGTMFLVFGSGTWRWRDVSDDQLLHMPPAEQAEQPSLAADINKVLDGLIRN